MKVGWVKSGEETIIDIVLVFGFGLEPLVVS